MRRSLKRNRLRMGCVKIVFLLVFLIVGGRAFHLQVFQGDKLMRLGQRQHLKEWIVLPKRGALFDRGSEPLALSLESQSVYVRPHGLQNHAEAEPKFGPYPQSETRRYGAKARCEKTLRLGQAPDLASGSGKNSSAQYGRHWHVLGTHAPLSAGQLGRTFVGIRQSRFRRAGGFGAASTTTIFAVRRDLQCPNGMLSGAAFWLRGWKGYRCHPAAMSHLTLDSPIQHLAEKELAATIQKYRAKAGVAIVVDPATGEVLALANYPTFDPNYAAQQSADQRRNRAVTDSFEPGSTFKTILAAAALEEGMVGKDDLFYCEMGKYQFAGRVIHDTHPQGWLSFSKILQVSSNIGFTKVAEKLNKDRYFKYIDKFGFGRVTGLDVPGEVPGLLRKPRNLVGYRSGDPCVRPGYIDHADADGHGLCGDRQRRYSHASLCDPQNC